MERYSVITQKNPRELVLLRGRGCAWRRCAFCDYHLDASPDESANFALNRAVLSRVTGAYHRLEVINSGSFTDLDAQTVAELLRLCREKEIRTMHTECHWIHRQALPEFRERFARAGVRVVFKTGVETFDIPFRERVLKKGLGSAGPEEIAAAGFGEINLLCGLAGQTAASMLRDVETGLAHFDRVCVNLMTPNTAPLQPDAAACRAFMETVWPRYREEPRVDILLENTDFGVG